MKFLRPIARSVVVASLLFSFSIASIAPATSFADQNQDTQQSHQKSDAKKRLADREAEHKKAKKTSSKTVTQTHVVHYKTQKQNDPNLPKGQKAILQAGHNGKEKITYKITYTKGKKPKKTLISRTVIVAPIPKIVGVGTYVAPPPAPAAAPAPTANTYTNSDGNQVESPDSNTSGATGICNDGTYTHAVHHQGACSSHGGVAQWL